MITTSPSGALSPYYYKGGYFHGIHYGSYFQNTRDLFDMMEKEQEFILRSPERRGILIELYETDLTDEVLVHIVTQVNALNDRIIKLAFATEKNDLKKIKHALKRAKCPVYGRCFFDCDMETGKTWLVSDCG